MFQGRPLKVGRETEKQGVSQGPASINKCSTCIQN